MRRRGTGGGLVLLSLCSVFLLPPCASAAQGAIQIPFCSTIHDWRVKLRFAQKTFEEREEGLRSASQTYGSAQRQLQDWKAQEPTAPVDKLIASLGMAKDKTSELVEFVGTAQRAVGMLEKVLTDAELDCSASRPTALTCDHAEEMDFRLDKIVEFADYAGKLTIALRNFSKNFTLPGAWSGLEAEVRGHQAAMQTHWAMFGAIHDALADLRKELQALAAPCAAAPETPPTPQAAPAPTTPPAAALGPATPIPPAAAAALFPRLAELAKKQALGMTPDAAAVAARLQQGQVFEQPLTIGGGSCYTILAVGEGVARVDLQLVTDNPPMPPVVMAQGTADGAGSAALGGGGACYRNPLPIAGRGKVVVKATSGAGLVLLQAFRK